MPAIWEPKENCSAAAPRSGGGPMASLAAPLVSQTSHRCPLTMPLLSARWLNVPAPNQGSLSVLPCWT